MPWLNKTKPNTMKKNCTKIKQKENQPEGWGIFRKLLTTFCAIVVLLLSFQTESKAESYRLKAKYENHYVIEFEGLNIGWWPWYTRVRVFTNDISPGATYNELTITTGGTYTMNIPYKGNPGTNKVYTTAIVYLAAYGPYHRFDFTAPKLKAPSGVSATTDELNQITLNWSKETAYTDGDVDYLIYNGTTWISNVPGNQTSYTVTGLENGDEIRAPLKT